MVHKLVNLYTQSLASRYAMRIFRGFGAPNSRAGHTLAAPLNVRY